jgi:O-antigen biosynthesis protein WbqP
MKNLLKFTFDWIVSFIAILVFLPLLIIPISLLIHLTSKGPVLFKQKRIGQNKKTYYLFKFRYGH